MTLQDTGGLEFTGLLALLRAKAGPILTQLVQAIRLFSTPQCLWEREGAFKPCTPSIHTQPLLPQSQLLFWGAALVLRVGSSFDLGPFETGLRDSSKSIQWQDEQPTHPQRGN